MFSEQHSVPIRRETSMTSSDSGVVSSTFGGLAKDLPATSFGDVAVYSATEQPPMPQWLRETTRLSSAFNGQR